MAAGSTIADHAARLPWIRPAVPAMIALAAGDAVADDPALALMALRYSPSARVVQSFEWSSFRDSAVLESLAVYVEADVPGDLDEVHPVVVALLERSRRAADHAAKLAMKMGTVNPDVARVAALVYDLGTLAAAVIDADAVGEALAHPEYAVNPSGVEERLWGITAETIARRLTRRWKLPAWSADAGLLRVVKMAIADVLLPAPRFGGQRLGVRGGPASVGTTLPIPISNSLLPALLRTAARARRTEKALAITRRDFNARLHSAKLDSLAEFAAGAGHEINNPLAVISGNAQLLRGREEDDAKRKSLDTIIRQTGRVAELLRDVMAFARPTTPRPVSVSLAEVIAGVVEELTAQAQMKQVAIAVDVPAGVAVTADAGQVRKIVYNLMRNAIEHAAGSVNVNARLDGGMVNVSVIDDGDGPAADALPHLFDPFYSGRDAGRGRGLGLATAWRFARENGGALRFERVDDRTVFIVALPWADLQSQRISA